MCGGIFSKHRINGSRVDGCFDLLASVCPRGPWLIIEIRGILAERDQAKLGWLVYYLSLPALIFYYVAQQPFADLIDVPIVVSTLSVTLLVAVLFFRLRYFV